MTESETKEATNSFNKFIKETRLNFGHLFKDRLTDRELMEKIFGQDGVGGLKNEITLLRIAIEEQTKSFRKESNNLQEEIAGSTKVIIKETDKSKKRWFQMWKRSTKEEIRNKEV